MEPYVSHFEHLADIQALYVSQDTDDAVRHILAREPGSVFLPAVHLRVLYNTDAISFYLALSAALNGVNIFGEVFGEGALTLRMQIAELLEPDGMFKRRVLEFLCVPERPSDYVWMECRHNSDTADILQTREIQELSGLVKGFMAENSPHLVWIRGHNGSGRETTVLAAAEMPVLFADLGGMAADPERNAAALVLESKLLGALIAFCGTDELLCGGNYINMLLKIAEPVSRVLFFIGNSPPPADGLNGHSLTEISIPPPGYEKSLEMWETFAAPYTFDEPPGFEKLSSFRLSPAQMKRCLSKANIKAMVRGGGELRAGELLEVCREERTLLPGLGRTAPFGVEWDDLILPDDVKRQLEEAALRAQNSRKVYGDWGFGVKTPYGRGVAVLLEGLPGTGKTMAAHALAARAGMLLYKTDMSVLISKYIGETEKNLQALFDGAAGTDCALFFDEAEALFSKRTGVTDSKDRYSNMEVAFLLQKLEEYDGLAILATNMEKNFDDAFRRRFQYILKIPFPDETQRKRIWQSVFPKNAPLMPDIDYDYLAARYELSGSGIKSAALSAAFCAAEDNTPIDMGCIIKALNKEARKNGVIV